MRLKSGLISLLPLLMLGLAVTLYIQKPALLQKFQLTVFDNYMLLKKREYQPVPVKIIDIDDASLRKLGQWPWPRNKLAEMVNRLKEAGAAAIAFDILFAEEDRTSPTNIVKIWERPDLLEDNRLKSIPDHDEELAQAIAEANVTTGFVLTESLGKAPEKKFGFSYTGDDPTRFLEGYVGAVTSLPALEKAATGNGALNAVPEIDGVIRRLNLAYRVGTSLYPSLMAETLRIAQGASSYIIKTTQASGESTGQEGYGVVSFKIGKFEVPTEADGKFWIYYTDSVPERYIPAWKIFEDDFDTSQIEGNLLFIGTSAQGLRDIRATPLNPTTNGVEVHVQALEQILLGEFLERPDYMEGIEITGMVLIGILLVFVIARLSASWGAFFMIAAVGASFYGSWIAFAEHRLLVDPVTPSIVVLLTYLTESLRRYISLENEKKQIRNAFSHYMSPALVEKLAANPDALKLGGEMRPMTILFCDIRGFTTISELYNAEELTRFINRFLTPMTDVILSHSGTIDKYMGDAIMAFWNAPLDDEAHAANACRAALHMMSRLKEVNSEREQEAREKNMRFIPINIGIGLNTGLVCVGNMGSDQRFDYSVLGDDVNLASRLEGQSKTYGASIVIGQNTENDLKGSFATIPLDLIKVKGKTEAVAIYSLLGGESLAQNPDYIALRKTFEAAIAEYRKQQWNAARDKLKEVQALSQKLSLNLEELCELYEERIAEYEKTPPQPDWDGVYIATSK